MEEIQSKKAIIQQADARIVKTVRKLRKTKSIGIIETKKSQEENINNIKKDITYKKVITGSNSIKSTRMISPQGINSYNHIKKLEPIKLTRSSIKNINKISIDSAIIKPSSSSALNIINNKSFDYSTLKKYLKNPKTEFQKNILSDNNINKYKEECINLMKNDSDIISLLEKVKIIKDNNYLLYLNNNFFSKGYFLFVLEMLILETIEESNTLKVFRTNRNVLPLKTVKNNFYKEEIIKDLKIRLYENEYNEKFKDFQKNLNCFINDLQQGI